MPLWIEYAACAVCAISGVLAANGKHMDLFGAIILALVTALGGGTVRDLCLGIRPVFWITAPNYLVISLVTAIGTFILARGFKFPERTLGVADAFGLALFGIIGTEKALQLNASASVAIFMGVITGVAGGIIRDVLRSELPLVFRPQIYLYSTAIFGGASVFVFLEKTFEAAPSHRYIGMGLILVLLLAAMRWRLALPIYKEK